jgi:hypothetical protein
MKTLTGSASGHSDWPGGMSAEAAFPADCTTHDFILRSDRRKNHGLRVRFRSHFGLKTNQTLVSSRVGKRSAILQPESAIIVAFTRLRLPRRSRDGLSSSRSGALNFSIVCLM